MKLQTIKIEEKEKLWKHLQDCLKYLSQYSSRLEEEIKTYGESPYKYFDDYFTDDTRQADWLIYKGKIVGFSMVRFCQDKDLYELGEFCVFEKYQKLGLGSKFVNMILSRNKGRWRIGSLIKNQNAVRFWDKVCKCDKKLVDAGNELLYLWLFNY